MTCPRCHSEFETKGSSCPECGVTLLRNVSGVMKTSAVMIATRGERGFYNSVKDVPEPLRTQLLETTASRNSGTIVIADRAGKEQLTQAMARREASRDKPEPTRDGIAQTPLGASVDDATPETTSDPRRFARGHWLAWAGVILVLMLAAIVSAFFYLHW
jgi:hypothetical protein